jgi:hypothetical protein
LLSDCPTIDWQHNDGPQLRCRIGIQASPEKDQLRSTLSSRQLQGFVMPRTFMTEAE